MSKNELKPCGYFKKYKAINRPTCSCIPCREKYIDKLVTRPAAAPELPEDNLIWRKYGNSWVCAKETSHWMPLPAPPQADNADAESGA